MSQAVANLQSKTFLPPVERQEVSKCFRMWREDHGTGIAPAGVAGMLWALRGTSATRGLPQSKCLIIFIELT